MLYALAYAVACALLGLLVRWGRLSASDVELLALRHEARGLRRTVRRGAWRPTDRLVLAALSRCLPGRDWRVLPVHPATLRRWHRELLRRTGWVAGQRRGPGRPPLAPDLRTLIERLARENARWGYRRIRGELLKLGIAVCKRTISGTSAGPGRRSRPARPGRPSSAPTPTRSGACDFLQVTDLLLRPLFAFFVVELASRRVVHVGV